MTGPGESCDVLVAGAGMAGLASALSAAENGADVLLVEKMDAIGGSTLLSAGGMAFAGTDIQAREGVQDGPGQLRDDLLHMGGGFSDPALVDAYAGHQLDTFEWLRRHQVGFSSLQVGSGNSVARVHRVQTRQALDALCAAFVAHGGCLLTRTRIERLVRESEDGRVRAAVITGPGGRRTVAVRGGVVLASGGFSRNKDLVGRFAPAMLNAVPVGGEGSTGDGMLLAWSLGAGVRDMGFIRATFGSHPDAAGARNLLLHPIFKGAIMVNRDARRFTNESQSYKDLGDACLSQRDGIGYQVFDSAVVAKADPNAATYDFAGALARGFLMEAATIEDLAAKAGLDAGSLRATVDEYNAAVAGRRPDAFGRTSLPGGYPLVPIGAGPFYAYPSVSVLLSTYCGLTIDPACRVLDVFGAAIPGLYAAGEIVGGLHGANYVSGSSVGKAAIFGRIAGREAARALQRQPVAA